MKEEFDQARADLRELLDRVGRQANSGTSRAPRSTSSVVSEQGFSKGGRLLQAPGPGPIEEGMAPNQGKPIRAAANTGPGASSGQRTVIRKGGGLSLSRGDLDLMLGEVRAEVGQAADASSHGNGKTSLSLESLAQALNETRGGATRTAAPADGRAEDLTLSLDELARSLKNARVGTSEDTRAAVEKGANVRRPAQTQQGPRQPGDVAPTRQVPSARSEGRSSPLVGGEGNGNIDVNLLANLMRWVGSAKQRLGLRHLRSLLELYRLTGHLPPIVERAIIQLAKLSMMPDVAGYHAVSHDALIDALLGLHGIVYGSGRTPVGPAVSMDRSETGLREITQGDILYNGIPEDYPSSEADEVISAVSRKTSHGAETVMSDYHPYTAGRAPGSQGQHHVSNDTGQPSNGAGSASAVQKRGSDGGAHYTATTMVRKVYPSDVTDAEWRGIESLIPRVKPGGRPGKYERREILNGILYQARTACSWRSLPHDLPPWKIVHHYYRTWREDGSWEPIYEALFGDKSEPATNGVKPGTHIIGSAHKIGSPVFAEGVPTY